MHSTHNEGKLIVAERSMRILKNWQKICLQIYDFNIKIYIDKLDDIVNKYNSTYKSPIKIKSVGVKSSTYIDFDEK